MFSLFGSSFIGDLIVTAIVPGILIPAAGWLWRSLQLVGINVDAGHRASYTAAATRAAGSLVHLVAAGHVTTADLAAVIQGTGMIPAPITKLVAEVSAAAPDALKFFGLTGNVGAIANKVVGLAGALLAPGIATVPGA